jgi:hypothetical protein
MATSNPVNLGPVLSAQTVALTAGSDETKAALASALSELLIKIALESDQNQTILEGLTSTNGEIDSSVDAIGGLISDATSELSTLISSSSKIFKVVSLVGEKLTSGSGVLLSVPIESNQRITVTKMFSDSGSTDVSVWFGSRNITGENEKLIDVDGHTDGFYKIGSGGNTYDRSSTISLSGGLGEKFELKMNFGSLSNWIYLSYVIEELI